MGKSRHRRRRTVDGVISPQQLKLAQKLCGAAPSISPLDLSFTHPQGSTESNTPAESSSHRNIIVLVCGRSHERIEFAKLFANGNNPLHLAHVQVLDIQQISEPGSGTRSGPKSLGDIAYASGVGKQPFTRTIVKGKKRRWFHNSHNAGNDAATTLWAFVALATAELGQDDPVPFPFYKDSVLVAVDMENASQKPNELLSCGISTLDTRDVTSVPPGHNGEGWLPYMKFRDICLERAVGWINEHGPVLHLGNGDFDYGQTEVCEGVDFIRQALTQHLTVGDRSSAQRPTLTSATPVQGPSQIDEDDSDAEESDEGRQDHQTDLEDHMALMEMQDVQDNREAARHKRSLRKKKWKGIKKARELRRKQNRIQKKSKQGVSANEERTGV